MSAKLDFSDMGLTDEVRSKRIENWILAYMLDGIDRAIIPLSVTITGADTPTSEARHITSPSQIATSQTFLTSSLNAT